MRYLLLLTTATDVIYVFPSRSTFYTLGFLRVYILNSTWRTTLVKLWRTCQVMEKLEIEEFLRDCGLERYHDKFKGKTYNV